MNAENDENTTALMKNALNEVFGAVEPLIGFFRLSPVAFQAQNKGGTRPTRRHNATICGDGSGNGTREYNSGAADFLIMKDKILLANR